MRSSLGFMVAVLLVSACRTPPEVVPKRPDEPQAKVTPPFALTKLTAQSEGLLGLTMHLEGALGPGVTERDLTWTAKRGEQVVGSGTTKIEEGENNTFIADLPIKWGENTADLEPLQSLSTLEVLLETQLGKYTATRSLQVRSPKLPSAKMLTVQASRTGPQSIGVTFLIALRNPNLFEVRFSNLQYTAFMAEKNVSVGTIPGGTRIPPAAETQFEIPVEANPENCGKDMAALLKMVEMPWSFTGKMRYGTVELPVDLGGHLKVSTQ
jgi:LEA14-like dessication related protein